MRHTVGIWESVYLGYIRKIWHIVCYGTICTRTVRVAVYMYMYICMCVHTGIRTNDLAYNLPRGKCARSARVCVCMYVYVHLYICAYICVYVCVYVYINASMYTICPGRKCPRNESMWADVCVPIEVCVCAYVHIRKISPPVAVGKCASELQGFVRTCVQKHINTKIYQYKNI